MNKFSSFRIVGSHVCYCRKDWLCHRFSSLLLWTPAMQQVLQPIYNSLLISLLILSSSSPVQVVLPLFCCSSSSHGSLSSAAKNRPSNSVATISTALICQVISSPTYEPIVFFDVDRYKAWRGAMRKEIQALRSNDTWSLVPFHSLMNFIGNW